MGFLLFGGIMKIKCLSCGNVGTERHGDFKTVTLNYGDEGYVVFEGEKRHDAIVVLACTACGKVKLEKVMVDVAKLV